MVCHVEVLNVGVTGAEETSVSPGAMELHGLLLLLATASGRHLPRCTQYTDPLGNTRLHCSDTVWRNGELEAQTDTGTRAKDMQETYVMSTMKPAQDADNDETISQSNKAASSTEEAETAVKISEEDKTIKEYSEDDEIAIKSKEETTNSMTNIEEDETAMKEDEDKSVRNYIKVTDMTKINAEQDKSALTVSAVTMAIISEAAQEDTQQTILAMNVINANTETTDREQNEK